jgi:4-hydroxybenzoate polyprenyltransferase
MSVLNSFRPGHYIRLSSWWTGKAAPLMAWVYLFFWYESFPVGLALQTLAASVVTTLGIGAFGYWLNDWSDIAEDRAAGKVNRVASLTLPQRWAGLGLTVGVAILPWLAGWLPLTPLTLGFLVAEAAVFMAYSLPPIRLKKRGFAGVLADALYAHALPLAFAGATMQSVGDTLPDGQPPEAALWLSGLTWSLCLGLRNILTHQLADAANDRRSGTRTFVVRVGVRLARALRRSLIGAEVVLFISLLLAVNPVWPVVLLVYWLFKYALYTRVWRQIPRADPMSAFDCIHTQFYAEVLPYLFLLPLATRSPHYWVLVALHVLVFLKPTFDTLNYARQTGQYLTAVVLGWWFRR